MSGEILKGAVQGINQGISKSPFPNPVGTVASGVKGVVGGFKGYKKRQQAEATKASNKIKKQNKLQEMKNKAITKQKQAQGKAYLNKLKAKLEGNNTPNLSPKKPVMSPAQGVAGQIGFKPAQPVLPKVSSGKVGSDFIKAKQAEGQAAIKQMTKPSGLNNGAYSVPKVHLKAPKKPSAGLSEEAIKAKLGL